MLDPGRYPAPKKEHVRTFRHKPNTAEACFDVIRGWHNSDKPKSALEEELRLNKLWDCVTADIMSTEAREGRLHDMKSGRGVTDDGRPIPEHLRRLYLSGS